jgi:glycosyltransferase involved in cell wall biosynthesis/2-polyprenyl-3-methyl-5-hydroxy-6-metoxy-1,4-benzoquinol methylase
MSARRPLRTVGVLPALGSGLTDLKRTGQHDRLLNYDLRQYCEAYDRVYYASYFRESLADFTDDPLLLDKIVLLPKRGPWPARLYAVLLPFLYRRQFRECEALRVEQFTGVLPALVANAFFDIPFAVTYGYHYGEVARLTGSRLKPLLYRWLERVAFPRAAGVIVTSREMETLLSSHPSKPRLAYFPNGVDTQSFAPAARGRTSPAPRIVLYVGRLEREKNVAGLIDALATVKESPLRLVLLGDGRLREQLERQARASRIDAQFLGVIPHGQLPRHFQSADCFVLPSLTEGHPKALIEAMACGLPCAASARGGIPSILEDGVTGLLFDPEAEAEMARTIGRLLADRELARRLGERARVEALAQYDAHVLLKAEVAFVQSVSSRGAVTGLFEDYAAAVPMDEALPEFTAARIRELVLEGPRSVLDLGAGDGRYLELLAPALPSGARLVGCEISLVRARRIRARGFRVVVGRSEALPFRNGAFDLVTFMEVIEHTESPVLSVEETRRVLRPGGRVALTTPNYPMKRLFDLRAAVRQRSWARLKDDPTHISPLSAGRLERLLLPRFEQVHLEGTAIPGEGHLQWLGRFRRSRVGLRLSNKLFALCTRGR